MDCDISHIISGVDIHRQFYALSLTYGLNVHFSNYEIFFEPVPDQQNTYRIDKFLPDIIRPMVPVTRTLYIADDESIEAPSSHFLAIHRAIAYILHLSRAGDYIDKILNDMDEPGVYKGGDRAWSDRNSEARRLAGWCRSCLA